MLPERTTFCLAINQKNKQKKNNKNKNTKENKSGGREIKKVNKYFWKRRLNSKGRGNLTYGTWRVGSYVTLQVLISKKVNILFQDEIQNI